MNDAYIKVLKRIMSDDCPAKPTVLTRKEIETRIAEVSATLKGPLSNVDRLDFIEARRELRKQLAALE